MPTRPLKTTFLGAGTMGEALLNGSLTGGVDPDTVTVTSRHRERADQLASTYGVHGTTDTAAAVAEAQLVIVALPPDRVPDTLRSLGDTLRPHTVVVSLADGVTLSDLAEILPDGVGVVRAMPSLTARVGQGLTLLTAHPCSETQLDDVTSFFSRSGEVLHVEEGQQARLAPLSSGGSAHILYVVDAMVEAAALRGVPRDVARKVMTQTLTGTAALLDGRGDLAPSQLREQMCAPGGGGIRRIAALDRRGVRSAFLDALTD
ncbi:MAG: pyrroline-5-carboxylate reductase family protein [Corynebacterium sp.]|uniref:pyrroline-5-carboxylate reductase family protein n=1 Tax=Corynebacterium sp. TaxID=1720 RepID=UPI003F11A293